MCVLPIHLLSPSMKQMTHHHHRCHCVVVIVVSSLSLCCHCVVVVVVVVVVVFVMLLLLCCRFHRCRAVAVVIVAVVVVASPGECRTDTLGHRKELSEGCCCCCMVVVMVVVVVVVVVLWLSQLSLHHCGRVVVVVAFISPFWCTWGCWTASVGGPSSIAWDAAAIVGECR